MTKKKPASLTRRARALFPHDRTMAAKHVLAVRHLRSKALWIMDGAPAKWSARPERRKWDRTLANPYCVEVCPTPKSV